MFASLFWSIEDQIELFILCHYRENQALAPSCVQTSQAAVEMKVKHGDAGI